MVTWTRQRLDPNQGKASVDDAATLIEEHIAKGRVATDERLNP
jgi:hypothetical protein